MPCQKYQPLIIKVSHVKGSLTIRVSSTCFHPEGFASCALLDLFTRQYFLESIEDIVWESPNVFIQNKPTLKFTLYFARVALNPPIFSIRSSWKYHHWVGELHLRKMSLNSTSFRKFKFSLVSVCVQSAKGPGQNFPERNDRSERPTWRGIFPNLTSLKVSIIYSSGQKKV